jgi:hypothetical protein
MQATQPITTLNHLKAVLAAIVVAAALVAAIVLAAFVAGSYAGPADAGANAGSQPVVLDSDARQAPGNRGAIAPIAQ